MQSFTDLRINDNIRKCNFEEKDEIIWDLLAIDHSFTGRTDANIANTFILEASQLLVNSIVIFEMGYFDAAYYSLRESLEVATLMAFFVDLPEEKRNTEFKKWKNPSNRFSMQKQMLNELKDKGDIIHDMKKCMPSFFDRIENISNDLNKYVHKQGFDKLYLSSNHPISLGTNPEKIDKIRIEKFSYYLKECISIVAIMRLSIDPMPVLLLDDDIFDRTNEIISEPYPVSSVVEYLKEEDLENYKKTEIYINTYNDIMKFPKTSRCVTDIYKGHCIDLEKMDIILNEIDLLKFPYNIATLLIIKIDDVTKVSTYGGFMTFYSSRDCKRKDWNFSSTDFRLFDKDSFNNKYKEVYMSLITIKEEVFYIEHNNKFSINMINYIKELQKELDNLV